MLDADRLFPIVRMIYYVRRCSNADYRVGLPMRDEETSPRSTRGRDTNDVGRDGVDAFVPLHFTLQFWSFVSPNAYWVARESERLQEKLHNVRLRHLPQNYRTHSKNWGRSRTVST